MKLYDFARSGAAYRTRIALALKGLEVERVSVHLTRDGGEQFKDDYAALNPQNLVPLLIDGEVSLTQSMAIMEYLEETHPQPPLLPKGAAARARVRALANIVACDIHPINNLRIRLYLVDEMEVTRDNRKVWMEHWIRTGFRAMETMLANDPATGTFCHGDTPTLADAFLIPQYYNGAVLNKIDLSDFTTLTRIHDACQAHPAFIKAHPDNQPSDDA